MLVIKGYGRSLYVSVISTDDGVERRPCKWVLNKDIWLNGCRDLICETCLARKCKTKMNQNQAIVWWNTEGSK